MTRLATMYMFLLATPRNFGRVCRQHGVAAFSVRRTSPRIVRHLGISRDVEDDVAPWSDPRLTERAQAKKSNRARQHVNPLANKFQKPTELSPEWPKDVFDDLSKPLFLDIGCSRGGFLIDMAKARPDDFNYLGLEIRPIVVYQAKQRIETHNLQGRLDFVGCNANVDLKRLLTTADVKDTLKMCSIQFPDPHFKARHAKRRVVTPELVTTLAEFMPEGAIVFLQSDIQSVLDDMRLQFRLQETYFSDDVENVEDYLEENVVGIPTEREVSVLDKGLPVYRTTFTRTSNMVPELTA
jgi:tRNA (guanine-N7-)-methyltransferase